MMVPETANSGSVGPAGHIGAEHTVNPRAKTTQIRTRVIEPVLQSRTPSSNVITGPRVPNQTNKRSYPASNCESGSGHLDNNIIITGFAHWIRQHGHSYSLVEYTISDSEIKAGNSPRQYRASSLPLSAPRSLQSAYRPYRL